MKLPGTIWAQSSLFHLTSLPEVIAREATMYQGGFPENFIIQDPLSFLVEGTNVIAIQGHNSDPASSDFSLIPMLSIGRIGIRICMIPCLITFSLREENCIRISRSAMREKLLFYPGRILQLLIQYPLL